MAVYSLICHFRLAYMEKPVQSASCHKFLDFNNSVLDEKAATHENSCNLCLACHSFLQYHRSPIAIGIYWRYDHNIHLDHIAHYKQKIKNTVNKKTERSLFRFFVLFCFTFRNAPTEAFCFRFRQRRANGNRREAPRGLLYREYRECRRSYLQGRCNDRKCPPKKA